MVRRARRFVSAIPVVVMLVLGVTSGRAQGQVPSAFPPDSVVFGIIRQRVAEKRAAGIVVGLLDADGRTRVVAFGDPGPGKPPVDGNSVFEIGSITKVFTATVLAELVQERKVKLDDPAQLYLPATVHLPSHNGKAITLGNLSSQNSGLPRMPDNFHPKDQSNPYADYSVEQLYAFLSSYQLTRDPGEKFEYSNLGVGLLGHILALRTGASYEAMVRERIWKPLGMTHTAITLTPYMKEHLALGHDPDGKVVANWDLPTLAGAGAIRSSTIDMLKFAAANLHPERGPLERAMATAHEVRGPVAPPRVMIGLNWMIQREGADTIVWHNGGTGGYRTFLGLDPSRRIAVVIMTNSSGVGSDDIGMHLLDPAIQLAAAPAPAGTHVAIELPASELATFGGRYQLAPGFVLEVRLQNGLLYAQATGQDAFRIWPEAPREFFYQDVDAQVTFVADSAGKITGLVFHQNGNNVPAKKIQ